jgi:hypothetical protein
LCYLLFPLRSIVDVSSLHFATVLYLQCLVAAIYCKFMGDTWIQTRC